MLSFLFLTLINTDLKTIQDIKPIYSINDDTELDGHSFISFPFDVLIIGETIYVVGGSEKIHVFKNNQFSFSFGKSGKGPTEFEHFPEKIEHFNNEIFVTETYGWSRIVFSDDGSFIRKESLDKNYIYIAQNKFEIINHFTQNNTLYRLKTNETCLLGKMKSNDELEYQKSNFLLLIDELKNTYFIRKWGNIEVFNNKCSKTSEIQLQVGDLVREPVPDPMLTSAYKQLRSATRKYLLFSNPIFDAALGPNTHGQEIWLLASNEWKMSHKRRPTEVWLMVANMKTGKVSRTKLDRVYDKVRVFKDKVALVSASDALVNIYAREDLITNTPLAKAIK